MNRILLLTELTAIPYHRVIAVSGNGSPVYVTCQDFFCITTEFFPLEKLYSRGCCSMQRLTMTSLDRILPINANFRFISLFSF